LLVKDGSLKEIVNVDARLVVLAFCLLVLLQLVPSYFLFGMRALAYSYYGPAYLIWIALGAGVVSVFISAKSGRLVIVECIVAAALYCLAIFFIYGGHKGFASRVPPKTTTALFLVIFLFSIAGSVLGRLYGLRKERKAQASSPS
jgi:hypothetical protein